MRLFITVLMICLGVITSQAQRYSDSISVNFFLLTDCRISQNITGEIRYVLAEYADGPFTFQSYFPGSLSNTTQVEQFLGDYQLELPYRIDFYKTKTRFYQATIAPQVVVFDEKNKRILYTGRIDNSYDTVGSRRRVITAHDLRDALAAIQLGEPIPHQETQAIGCVINTK